MYTFIKKVPLVSLALSLSALLLVVLSLIYFTAPVPASAQFVPCDGVNSDSGVACTECHLIEMGNTVLVWLIGIMFIIFGFVAVSAGWGLMTAGGRPEALSSAKSKFTNAFIGLLIVLVAWLLVDTIMRQLLNGGAGELGDTYSGFGVWSEIECGSMVDARAVETELEDFPTSVAVSPSPGGYCPIGYTFDAFGSCVVVTGPVLPDAGGNCPVGYTFDAFGSCVLQSGPIAPDAGGNCPAGYTFDPFGDCEFIGSGPGNVTVNESMGPIFDPASGGSSMVQSGAQQRMEALLAGPFACLQRAFGRSIVINDAIAKSGTSRETNTPGSRHFHGDALDLSTAGMSDADKIRLFQNARGCGFSGFGFGNTILHVDLGSRRGWAYGNSTYGGQSVQSLIGSI